MSFDEQLRQAFDTLSDRLRDTLARETQSAIDGLAAAARAAADDAARQATETARAAADEGARRATESARETADAAVAAARTDMRAAEQQGRERLLDAVRAIDGARSLTEIFDALTAGAARQAPRAAVLLVRDAALRSWRFAGFSPSMNASHDAELPLQHAGVIGEAIRTLAATSADRADHVPSAPFDLPNGRRRTAVPIAMSGQVVAVVYADEAAADDPDRTVSGWEPAVEILARHAARALEALTALKAARSLSERGAVVPISSTDGGDRPSDAEEAARRYARLLVSEIKMYHEADVAAGQRERDLATRLGGEIQRARALYEARVPAQVRLRTDFFQAELVRTLANGDASLLEAKR